MLILSKFSCFDFWFFKSNLTNEWLNILYYKIILCILSGVIPTKLFEVKLNQNWWESHLALAYIKLKILCLATVQTYLTVARCLNTRLFVSANWMVRVTWLFRPVACSDHWVPLFFRPAFRYHLVNRPIDGWAHFYHLNT